MYHERILNVNGNPNKVLWPDRDRQCWDFILGDWQYMHEVISTLVPEKRVVIQAGGNAGLYPLLYSFSFQHVYTFEMDSECFGALAYNCRDQKITKINAAIGDKAQLIQYGLSNVSNVGMASLLKNEGEIRYAHMITIDSLNIQVCDLIHLDIEGAEYWALQGAFDTIQRCRPIIVLEMTDFIEDIFTLMGELDYQELFVFDPHLVNPVNVIFAPRERI